MFGKRGIGRQWVDGWHWPSGRHRVSSRQQGAGGPPRTGWQQGTGGPPRADWQWDVTRAALGSMIGAGSIGMAAAVFGAVLSRQADMATRAVQNAAVHAAPPGWQPPEGETADPSSIPVPRADGWYHPDGTYANETAPGERGVRFVVLGDSAAVGYGAARAAEVPGVVLARNVAARVGRPVHLGTFGHVGAVSADLAGQVNRALPDGPDIALIVIGGNDVRAKVAPFHAAAMLGDAVAAMQAAGVGVVVGTCPDFGVLMPIPQPLRTVLRWWSHRLAVLQDKAVIASGGQTVAIGRLVSPQFAGRPELFFADHFHPSGAGYARAVAALLPSLLAAASADRSRMA